MKLRRSLEAFPFDRMQFDALCAAYRKGKLRPEDARLAEAPSVLTEEHPLFRRTGDGPLQHAEDAIARGELAVVVMNGGMATRFGGVAKGITPALTDPDQPTSFLSLKLRSCNPSRGNVPVVVMNSFATESASLEHLEQLRWHDLRESHRLHFSQSLLPRIDAQGETIVQRKDGELFPDREAFAPPGHGDTIKRLRESGVLEQLTKLGVKHVMVSNVDNLGATPDPIVFAEHLAALEGGAKLSVEVVPRLQGDRGGCIGLVNDRPMVIEGFRLPEDCSPQNYPQFNTNTLWFSTEGLEDQIDLSWFAVERKVRREDNSEITAIQFEQLIGQASEFLPTSYIEVDRQERFLPIKTKKDLELAQPQIRAWAQKWG